MHICPQTGVISHLIISFTLKWHEKGHTIHHSRYFMILILVPYNMVAVAMIDIEIEVT